MRAGSSIRQSAMLFLLGIPAALPAQDLPAPPSALDPVTATDSADQLAQTSQCETSGEPNGNVAPMAVRFAGTGDLFTLPPDLAENAATSCEDAVPPMPPRPIAPDIFGLSAVPVGLKPASKEGGAWDKVRNAGLQGQTGPWTELLGQPDLRAADNLLIIVNSWVNWHVRYSADKNPNDWNAAATTLLNGRGDCADYAIAKMALLQQLGIGPEDMFLIVLRDEARSIDHAVLAVRQDGTMYVLDNQTDLVLPAERIHDYRPILSYNGPFAWVYGKRTTERAATAEAPENH